VQQQELGLPLSGGVKMERLGDDAFLSQIEARAAVRPPSRISLGHFAAGIVTSIQTLR
jgi:hypothetical protein